MEKQNWGLKVKELRESLSMTQEQLGAASGISWGYIRKIEIGLIKNPGRDTLVGLAKGFGKTLDDLNEIIWGGRLKSLPESADQILDRLRLAQPIAVPVMRDFVIHAGRVSEPMDYVYLPRSGKAGKNIEALIVHGNCLSPTIEENDVIIIDRDSAIDSGNIVACLYSGELHLGKFKKIGDEAYLENGHGRIKLVDCQVAATVIQVIRKLK